MSPEAREHKLADIRAQRIRDEVGAGAWQITPSINSGESVYHETPRIVGVPTTEPWVLGHAP